MTDHTCRNLDCGATFTGRRRKFCYACLPDHAIVGHQAYQDQYNQLMRSTNARTTRTCTVCAASFRTQNTSGRCWDCTKAHKKRCTICREIFSNTDGNSRCPRCRVATCVECGGDFVRGRRRRTCSSACSEALAQRQHREAGRRRKLRRRGAIKGPYHDLEIFDRDGWRCQICGGLTRPWHRVPHPLAPTIDHIVPISKGGDDVASNIQCAHFKCNTRKQASAADDQLRLVG